MGLTEQEKEQLEQVQALIREKEGVSSQSSSNIIEEAHPAIEWDTRLKAKNLASSTEQQIEYLKNTHPELEFSTDDSAGIGNQIIVKSPKENQWRRFDPDGVDLTSLSGLKELAQDVGDIGYDVGSGIVEGAATAAGGVAGASAGGVGAIPAAMAAGAGTGAGLDTLRQGLANYFGVKKGFDPEETALSGAFGAASPLLLGTGASAKQLTKEFGKEALAEALAKQRGLPKRAYDTARNEVFPSLAERFTGVPKQATKEYLKPGAEKLLTDLKGPEGFTKAAEAMRLVEDDVYKVMRESGQELKKSMPSDINVDIKPAIKILDDHIADIEKSALAGTDASKQRLANIKAIRDKYLVDRNSGVAMAQDFDSQVDDLLLQETNIKQALKSDPENIGLKNALKATKRTRKSLERSADKVATHSSDLETLPADAAFELRKMLDDEAEMWRFQTKTPAGQAMGQTEAPLDKEFLLKLRSARNAVNDALDKATKGMSKKARQQYAMRANLRRSIATDFADTDATIQTLREYYDTSFPPKHEFLKRRMAELKELGGGKGIEPYADMFSMERHFTRPGLSPIETRGLPLGALLGIGGAFAGGQAGSATGMGPGSYGLGGALGGLLGASLVSPYALKQQIRLLKQAEKVGPGGLQYIPKKPGAARSVWEMLRKNQNQEEEE